MRCPYFIDYGADHVKGKILSFFFFNFCDILIWLQLTYKSSNLLMVFAIDFRGLQLSLLKAHDSLEYKWIGKIYGFFFWKFFQFTFRPQLTLVNCTWSGPKCMKYLENLMNIFSPLRLKCLRILYKTSKGQKNDKT